MRSGHRRWHPDDCGPAYPRRRRLFWRVYLHGVGLLVLALATVLVVGALVRRDAEWKALPERDATRRAERYEALLGKPAALADELRRDREVLQIGVSVYDAAGALVATNVTPPLPAPPPDERERVRGGARVSDLCDDVCVVAPLLGGGHAVTSFKWPFQPRFESAFLVILAVLVVLALGSVPLVRSIVAPLERLTATARAFGRGDLSARTGLRRADQVGELARAMDDMAERLDTLRKAERDLLANVSHELRTPLARIRVALELAAEGDVETARRYLGEIGADLDDLDRLVSDVLTAARLDPARGGLPPLRRERLLASTLVEGAAERFRSRNPSRVLEVEAAAPLPEIDADEPLLRRVFDNLLDNARKYSDEGAPVTLAARREGDALVVEVRDRGIGVDAADLPQLFTPFFRTDRSRARGTGGVGLGLTLARRIIEAHGGTIAAESRAGEATTLRFRLPIA